MHNLYANFVKILEICKDFSKNLVNELGNIPRPGVVPRFSDLEVIALSLTAEHLSIDSENNLFDRLKEYKADMPNLISRRQFNDRRKFTAELCEKIRKRIASKMDGAEFLHRFQTNRGVSLVQRLALQDERNRRNKLSCIWLLRYSEDILLWV